MNADDTDSEREENDVTWDLWFPIYDEGGPDAVLALISLQPIIIPPNFVPY